MIKRGRTKSEGEKKQRFKLKKLKFRKIKTWVLLILLVVMLFVDATLLRVNHIHMVQLRDAVFTADESEDDEAINAALAELRDYTFSHIVINVTEENGEQHITFGTGPFYLEHQYNRYANAALEEAQAILSDDSNPNGNVYKAASDVCSPQAIVNGWDWNTPEYVNCMVAEINKYPAAEDLNAQREEIIASVLPSTELFRMNYASPLWVPSVAGFCLLFTLILIIVIFIRVLIWIFLRVSLLFV